MRRHANRFRLLSCLGIAAALLPFAGCTSRPAAQGSVTLDGAPVDGGSIAFIPVGAGEQQQRVGVPIVDGRYTIPADKRLAPGKYRVEIYWPKKTGRKVPIPDDPPNQM